MFSRSLRYVGLSVGMLFLAAQGQAACLQTVPAGYTCTTSTASVTEPAGSLGAGGAAGMPALGIWANYALTDPYGHGIPSKGYSTATVHSQFAAVMNYNFDSTKNRFTNIQIMEQSLTSFEWARLSFFYVEDGGNIQTLSDLIAAYNTPTFMHMLAGAFGPSVVASSVSRIQGATALAQYNALGAVTVIPRSAYHYQSLGLDVKQGIKMKTTAGLLTTANLDYTLYEIYLDFRTAGTGATVASALWSTGEVAYKELGLAYAAGYATGNAILWAADKIDPGFSDRLAAELGAGIEAAVNNITNMIPDSSYLSSGCGCSITVEIDDMVYRD